MTFPSTLFLLSGVIVSLSVFVTDVLPASEPQVPPLATPPPPRSLANASLFARNSSSLVVGAELFVGVVTFVGVVAFVVDAVAAAMLLIVR